MPGAVLLRRHAPSVLTALAVVIAGAAALPMRPAPNVVPLDSPRPGSDTRASQSQWRSPAEGQPDLARALANLKALSAQRHAEEETVRREQHALEQAQAEVTRQTQRTLAAEAKERQREQHEQLRRIDLERQEAVLRDEVVRTINTQPVAVAPRKDHPEGTHIQREAGSQQPVQHHPHRAHATHTEADVSSLMQSAVVAKPRRSGPHASSASMLTIGIVTSSSRVGLVGLGIGLLVLAVGAILGVLLIFAWPERQDAKGSGRTRLSNDTRLPELRSSEKATISHEMKTSSTAKLTPYLQEAMQPLTNDGAAADRHVRFAPLNSSPGSEDSELVHFSAHGQERLTFESAIY